MRGAMPEIRTVTTLRAIAAKIDCRFITSPARRLTCTRLSMRRLPTYPPGCKGKINQNLSCWGSKELRTQAGARSAPFSHALRDRQTGAFGIAVDAPRPWPLSCVKSVIFGTMARTPRYFQLEARQSRRAGCLTSLAQRYGYERSAE